MTTPIPPSESDECISINKYEQTDLINRLDQLGGKTKFFTTDFKTFKETPNKDEIASFIHGWLHTVCFNNKIYCYNRESGVYSQDAGQIKAIINEFARYCERMDLIPSMQYFVERMLLGKNVFKEYPFNRPKYCIPFRNKTLYLNDDRTGWDERSVSYTDMVTWRIPHNYNADSSIDPVLNVLQQWTDDYDYRILIQIPAHALYHQALKQPFKTAYLLVGEPDSGKSTYFYLLEHAFQGMISKVPLQLVGRQFKNAEMEGKLFNAYDDLKSTAINNTGDFKAHRGKFEHSIERKGEMAYDGNIKCVYLFTSNPPLPKVDEVNDDGFFGSWKLLVFEHHFDRDPTWCDRTFTEDFISGFFNLILMEYLHIMVNGLQNEQTAEEVRDLWLGTTEEKKFIDTKLIRNTELEIDTTVCYELYVQYKKEKGEFPKPIEQFGKGIMYLGITKHRPRKNDSGKQKAVYRGIGVKEPINPQQPILS